MDRYLEKIIRKIIDMLNGIIRAAIEYGGDSGGAYCLDASQLISEMQGFLRWAGLNKTVGIMNESDWVRFYIKSDIVAEQEEKVVKIQGITSPSLEK